MASDRLKTQVQHQAFQDQEKLLKRGVISAGPVGYSKPGTLGMMKEQPYVLNKFFKVLAGIHQKSQANMNLAKNKAVSMFQPATRIMAKMPQRQAMAQPSVTPTMRPPSPTPTSSFKLLSYKRTTPTPTPDPRASWNNFAKMVIDQGNERGYHGLTLARQKALESAYGTSQFAKDRYNYGGIGAYDSDPNKAFRFKSPEEYLNYYFDLIEKRYPKAYEKRANSKEFVRELKKGGYASDPDYEWKVLNTPVWK